MTDIKDLICPVCREKTFSLYRTVADEHVKYIVACICGFGGLAALNEGGAIKGIERALDLFECQMALDEREDN